MTIVFTNGVFDILHVGHIKLLKHCKELAQKTNGTVVVGLNSDDSVKRLKGCKRPINSALDRKCVLESLRYVDSVVIFVEDTPIELIRLLNPNFIVKGGDYKQDDVVGVELVGHHNVIIVPTFEGKSTTSIINHF